MLFAYSLGKAQRVLAGLGVLLDDAAGPIFTHGAVENFSRLYREAGIALAPTTHVAAAPAGTDWSRALILAPPSANGTPWIRRFGPSSTAFVSGWMRIRGARRRRSLDRGFVLSDHADWPGLMTAIRASGATRVWVTHGYRAPVVEWLKQQGLDAQAIETRFEGEQDEIGAEPTESRAMKAFADLYAALDETTKTNEKVEALTRYFSRVPPADAAWAATFLIGRRPKRSTGIAQAGAVGH